MGKQYVDEKGRLIFVRGGDTFMAMYQDVGKWGAFGAHRLVSKELPVRNTLEEAQADLDAYAEKKGWKLQKAENECPYFNGTGMDGRKPIIRCGKDYLKWFNEDAAARDKEATEKCCGDFKNCRAYIMKQLKELGVEIDSGWSTEEAARELAKVRGEKHEDEKPLPEICRQCENEETGCVPNNPETGECVAFMEKNPEKIENTALEIPTSSTVQEFDYSTVDDETAAFLQEKANRVTEIRIKSVIAIGKELSETFDKLSKVGYGEKTKTFEKWVESLGISSRHARRYIDGYNYVVKNFHNIEDAEKIQPSLLFAISKPSAPTELQEKVLSGDITTHKQYKELEEKLRKLEEAKRKSEEHYQQTLSIANENRIKAEIALKNTEEESKRNIDALSKTVRDLQQQLDQARRNGSQEKVQELGEIISEKQREIEKLRQQLKEKPIEVTAAQIVEVIPQDIRESIVSKVSATVNDVLGLSVERDIEIFVEELPAYEQANFLDLLSAAINRLHQIELAINEKSKNKSKKKTPQVEGQRSCKLCQHLDTKWGDAKGNVECDKLKKRVDTNDPTSVCEYYTPLE